MRSNRLKVYVLRHSFATLSFDETRPVRIELVEVKAAPRHATLNKTSGPALTKWPRKTVGFCSHLLAGGLALVRKWLACPIVFNPVRRAPGLLMAAIVLTAFSPVLNPVRAQQKEPGNGQKSTTDYKDRTQNRPGRRDTRAESGATSQSTLALPFKRAWEYLAADPDLEALDSDQTYHVKPPRPLPPTLDGSRVYLPLPGTGLLKGEVVCLERNSGVLLWSSDLGGWISVPIAVGKMALYLVTEKPSADRSQASGSISALDPITGLTLWARDYPRRFTSPPALDNDRIYVGSEDGAFYAISTANGDVVWKVQTQDIVRGRPLITDTAIYIGSDDGAVREIDKARGTETWKYQTEGRVTACPILEGRYLYLASGDACIYCIDMERRKIRWRYRTGGAIEASPILTGDRLLVGSLDNFLYALSKSTGNHIWKRRMEDRVTSCPVIDGDTVMATSFRSDHVAMFLSHDGRRVNYYRLSKGDVLVADPVYSDGTLLLRTDKGLVVADAEHVQPPKDSKEALKKP